MLTEYRQAIQLALGNAGRYPQLRIRDSAQHTPAHRRRYYFTNSLHTDEPPNDTPPWSDQWISVSQVTHNTHHKMLPVVRPQGHDKKRGMHRHSHIALHPYSLLYHQATLPPESLQAAANSGLLLDPSFCTSPTPTANTLRSKPSTPATSSKTMILTNTLRSSPTPSRTHVCTYQSDRLTPRKPSRSPA